VSISFVFVYPIIIYFFKKLLRVKYYVFLSEKNNIKRTIMNDGAEELYYYCKTIRLNSKTIIKQKKGKLEP
jgi:hypothetical protein